MSRTEREHELKLDVPEAFRLPELAGRVDGIAGADEPEQRALEATYFDTADQRLLRGGITLRRRTGGPDAGWHLKLPAGPDPTMRDEIHAPLDAGADRVPGALAGLVTPLARRAPLVPVATLRTTRTAVLLRDEDGRPVAEVVDDVVVAETPGAEGPPVTTAFRELEVEAKGSGDGALLQRVAERLGDAGARPGAQLSKLLRALGHQDRLPPLLEVPQSLDPGAPARALVAAYLREQVAALQTQDPRVRLDAEDSVHKMRVAVRRLRSGLRTFGPLLQADAAALAGELRWLAGVLGVARDAEVLLARLQADVAGLPPELVLGAVAARVEEHLLGALLRARQDVLEALAGERYLDLIDAVVAFAADPPVTPEAAAPIADVVPPLVRRAYRKLAKRAGRLDATGATDGELHAVRIAAKRARYAGEAVERAFGDAAEDFAERMEAVQEVLGEHQDSVVARQVLRDLALRAQAGGENAFTFGLLYGREMGAAADTRRHFAEVWAESRRKRHRAWLG